MNERNVAASVRARLLTRQIEQRDVVRQRVVQDGRDDVGRQRSQVVEQIRAVATEMTTACALEIRAHGPIAPVADIATAPERAAKTRNGATTLHQSAWAAFKSALFTPSEPDAV